jgi:hypothetical protein
MEERMIIFSYPENGSSGLHKNCGEYLSDYTASHPV